jgi:hypothetical protein
MSAAAAVIAMHLPSTLHRARELWYACLLIERHAVLRWGQVWSSQVFEFEEFESDGPGALRIAFQEELADQ